MGEQRKKIIILIGRSAAGKTTLCQRMADEDLSYHKTQTVQVLNGSMIDTPGEYLERKGYRGALMVSSYDADIIIFVQDATEQETMFPPSYTSSFTKPVIGVVTKCDLADEQGVERAEQLLNMAGVRDVFHTSSVTGDGVDALMKHLGYL